MLVTLFLYIKVYPDFSPAWTFIITFTVASGIGTAVGYFA